MLLLFVNLYLAMFTGEWINHDWVELSTILSSRFDSLGTFITSIFGDNTYSTLGTNMFQNTLWRSFPVMLALILGTITSIGIVVMAVKGVKKAFGIFFMGIRR